MYFSKFCLSSVLLLFVLMTSAQGVDSIVSYRKNIDWNLFQGIQNTDSLGAQISTKIHLEVAKVSIWNGRVTFKAFAIMNTQRSWVRPDYKTEYTLQHEQTHFNITELFARRFMAELNGMKLRDQRSPKVQSAFDKWKKEMEDTQNRYDADTKGLNTEKQQAEWNERIAKELEMVGGK